MMSSSTACPVAMSTIRGMMTRMIGTAAIKKKCTQSVNARQEVPQLHNNSLNKATAIWLYTENNVQYLSLDLVPQASLICLFFSFHGCLLGEFPGTN